MQADIHQAPPQEDVIAGRRSWLATAFSILLIGIVGNATIAVSPLLVSGMSEYLGFGDAYLGELAGAASAGASLSTVAALFFLDRVGWPLRKTAFFALLLYAAANSVLPTLFDRSGWLLLAFFVSGCASGLIWAISATAITTLPNTGRLVSIFYGTPYLTGLAIQPLMPSLYARWGVAPAFELIALACVLSLLTLRWFPARAIGAPPLAKGDPANSRRRRGLAWLILLPVAISLLLQYIANSGLWIYFDRVGLVAGHSHQMSANVVALGSGMALVGTLLATTLAPKLRPILAISAISMVMALATLGLLGAENYLLFAGSVFLFNAMITFITPFFFILLSQLPVSPGRAVLVGNLAMMAGFAAGPFLIGRMADGGDFTVSIYATSTMLLVSALIAIANRALGKSR